MGRGLVAQGGSKENPGLDTCEEKRIAKLPRTALPDAAVEFRLQAKSSHVTEKG